MAAAPSRPLADLVSGLRDATVLGDGAVAVSGLCYRSDEAGPGDLFFCIPGEHVDGHAFAAAAIERGAVAVVAEHPVEVDAVRVMVPNVRESMGPISAAFYGRPADAMTLVGVTGTNGKTTTTYLLEAVLRAEGRVPGVIGTTGVRIDGRPTPFPRTTPEAPDLQRLLAEMTIAGVDAVAMEVSSHGLDQHRVDGVRFDRAVFTNLTQDHLDYHASMREYFQAKARLFTPAMAEAAVVNHDTEEGRRLATQGLPTLSYGLDPGADVRATGVEATADGIAFHVDGLRIVSMLRGRFNVSNCLAAFATARSLGFDEPLAAEAIGSVRGVPGRVEAVEAGQPFLVLVDYAHTSDSLENVLRAARQLAEGRVLVVFGCGGDRDRAKRPLMGRAATTNADLAVITSDNPRSEDPEAIVREIEAGAREGGGTYAVETDRRSAIRLAVSEAGPGDVVVIAGKGHEPYQELADRTIAFDDREVAAEEIAALVEDA